MLTILGTLLGLLGGTLPQLLAIWKASVDAANNRQLIELQAKLALDADKFHAMVVENNAFLADRAAARFDADRPTGFAFIDFLSAAIRPVFSWTFFGLFFGVKLLTIYYMISHQGIDWKTASSVVLDAETNQFFTSIFGFWFGGMVGAASIKQKTT